ncbi:SHOCT domain-containing protein [Gordonia sp. (in: high G+C Gram-positive bacteria)]|uniref:SHOCT domain-containing protein n=1 Tax=Gordonia sp. (in: high G+C Gram-positive bacteria) TaxID=84139 RepID=UPI0016A4BCEE|nr:SHOCT domain-containing protein [Gordonia sp. (in: high G+C Gram-positive bacteria)]NLG45159.1 hypothetical protein [Gordonia sp. (in: high G+C Gram-positive bacteria)]
MDWSSFWNVIWYTVMVFAFIAYLMVLFMVLSDLFRDHKLAAGWKVVWIILLIVLPYITAFVYLLARGPGMAERGQAAAIAAEKANREYIRHAAGQSSPAADIATAKSLLDAGTITPEEYEALKAKALAA